MQEIPYRHLHEHDEDALNQGNFVELLKIICETNPVFEDLRSSVMKQYSIHQDYWSKTIFNEFVEAMADEVRTQIGKSIAEAGMFFLVIDECKDKAGHEQLSLCVRYSVGSTAKERFIGLVRLSENLSAAAIAEKILPLLSALSADSVFFGLDNRWSQCSIWSSQWCCNSFTESLWLDCEYPLHCTSFESYCWSSCFSSSALYS